jgi:hypothetical protein
MDALSAFASFQNAKNKSIAAVGKAAAIARATVLTFQAANLALATIPPPFGFIAAAANIAAGLGNVAAIAGIELQSGIDKVPGIGTRDNFPAILAPGERVVPRETNKDLRAFLIEQAGTRNILQSIDAKLGRMGGNLVVNVGGREIVNVLQSELRSGREINVS